MGTSILEERLAVEAGYWHLYRYNPALRRVGKTPSFLIPKSRKPDFWSLFRAKSAIHS